MKKNQAIFYMIFSVIAFAIMNALVKYLGSFNVYQIVFFRSIGTLFFTIPLVIKYNLPFFGIHKKLLLMRAIFGVASLTLFFESLNYLDIGTAVSIRYTSPIFASIFALFLLKEKIKPIQWLLFFITFFGVLLIKGFGTNIQLTGLILVLLSALFLGLVFVIIRKIGNKENPLIIINYFMIMAFVFGGIMSIKYWERPNINELFLLISLGVFGYVGQLYMTKAFQIQETNIIAPLKYFEVIFVIIIGATWFGEIYNFYTLIGILIILFGLIFNLKIKSKNG